MRRFPAILSILISVLGLAACDKDAPSGPPDDFIIVDSALVVDWFSFSRAACDEVLPAGQRVTDSLPSAPSVMVTVTSIACYAVKVQVVDSLKQPVRALEFGFDIPGRKDGDKERGELGYLPWDRKDEAGKEVPPGAYEWRMDFDFGANRTLKVVADMRLE